jgi:VIT1/CCC1 family predicted Fe2+/Mn2+ transporter
MPSFLNRHLAPVDRLGEILFGLIMALGFTGAVRLGREEANSRELFIGIFGCNLAWAIVDGVMYVLTELFERGRLTRLMREVKKAPTEEALLEQVGKELDSPLVPLTTEEERRQVRGWVLEAIRRGDPQPARVEREDLMGGLAVGLVILLATLPVLVPFLIFANPEVAVRVSNAVALCELFLLGARWGQIVGASPWRLATGLTLLGLVLVLVTIALGG